VVGHGLLVVVVEDVLVELDELDVEDDVDVELEELVLVDEVVTTVAQISVSQRSEQQSSFVSHTMPSIWHSGSIVSTSKLAHAM
jgi:hypothetical protein